MSRFMTPVVIEELPVRLHKRPFRLVQDVRYRTDVLSYNEIVVPANYQSDFASVPRFFWRIAPPVGGLYRRAALIHDWLCDEDPHTCTSKEAALVFKEAMVDLGVNKRKRTAMYWAVRLFGPRF